MTKEHSLDDYAHIKEEIQPFTASFITDHPYTTLLFRLLFAAYELANKDEKDAYIFLDSAVERLPKIMAWTEWDHYCHYNDKERLEAIFPPLLAYHQWLAAYRTWPNGTYWSSGWGCGMDNQLRVDHEEYDKFHHGHLTWVDTCIQQILSAELLMRLIAHLDDENQFKRPHRIPTLACSSKNYKEDGDYWKGGVWAPTNYMVLKGLERNNYFDLAHEIAMNHVANVVDVFKETGTLWENYMPEGKGKGNPAKPNFVGWTGLSPISILIEYVFGIRVDVPAGKIKWQVRLTEAHGVTQIPFGLKGNVTLHMAERQAGEKPEVTVESNVPVEVCWENGSYTIQN